MYIYITKNMVNGKMYIGKRQPYSPSDSQGYLGSGTLLKRAINKYGKDNFIKCILIDNITNENLLKELERHYIRLYNAVNSEQYYNMISGGDYIQEAKPGRRPLTEIDKEITSITTKIGMAKWKTSIDYDAYIKRLSIAQKLCIRNNPKAAKKRLENLVREYKIPIGVAPNGQTAFFSSAAEAARVLGSKNSDAVSRVCRGDRTSFKKWTFEYLN